MNEGKTLRLWCTVKTANRTVLLTVFIVLPSLKYVMFLFVRKQRWWSSLDIQKCVTCSRIFVFLSHTRFQTYSVWESTPKKKSLKYCVADINPIKRYILPSTRMPINTIQNCRNISLSQMTKLSNKYWRNNFYDMQSDFTSMQNQN